MLPLMLLAVMSTRAVEFGPGNHTRSIRVDGLDRSYLFHVPARLDPRKPAPVVLVSHGALNNAQIMAFYCRLNRKADSAGFLAAYPIEPRFLIGVRSYFVISSWKED